MRWSGNGWELFCGDASALAATLPPASVGRERSGSWWFPWANMALVPKSTPTPGKDSP